MSFSPSFRIKGGLSPQRLDSSSGFWGTRLCAIGHIFSKTLTQHDWSVSSVVCFFSDDKIEDEI